MKPGQRTIVANISENSSLTRIVPRLNAPGGAAVLGARYGVWSNTLPYLNFALLSLQGL